MNLHVLPAVLLGVLILNVPFGFWRAGARKFSPVWFLAVHMPIPLVVWIRLFAGVGWRLTTFPLFLAAYFGGQLVGGALRRRR